MRAIPGMTVINPADAVSAKKLIRAVAAKKGPAYVRLGRAAVPILYGGVCSVGAGYTLQVVVQRRAHPAHAAILLSLESPFAALGGWLLLGELLSGRALIGCSLMLAGMLLSQLWPTLTRKRAAAAASP